VLLEIRLALPEGYGILLWVVVVGVGRQFLVRLQQLERLQKKFLYSALEAKHLINHLWLQEPQQKVQKYLYLPAQELYLLFLGVQNYKQGGRVGILGWLLPVLAVLA
jgi:hypothetical protein